MLKDSGKTILLEVFKQRFQPKHSLQQKWQELLNWFFNYSTYLKKDEKDSIKKSDHTRTSKPIPKPRCANKEIFY